MSGVALLWTGGKGSALALDRTRHRVDRLVTFVPVPERPFLAHPLGLVAAQAEALGLPHARVPVLELYAAGYEAAIDGLVAQGVHTLVTGDIDRVAGHGNWIEQRARGRCAVEAPLWQADRLPLLAAFSARHGQQGFDAAGENGEYHSATLRAPGFRHALQLQRPRVLVGDGFHHLAFDGVSASPA